MGRDFFRVSFLSPSYSIPHITRSSFSSYLLYFSVRFSRMLFLRFRLPFRIFSITFLELLRFVRGLWLASKLRFHAHMAEASALLVFSYFVTGRSPMWRQRRCAFFGSGIFRSVLRLFFLISKCS